MIGVQSDFGCVSIDGCHNVLVVEFARKWVSEQRCTFRDAVTDVFYHPDNQRKSNRLLFHTVRCGM